MPPYNKQVPPPAIFPFPPGHTFLAFNAEAVVAGELSQQITLPPGPVAGTPKGVRVVIDHSAAPGNCEYYVVEADNDAAGVNDYNQVPAGGDLTQATLVAGPNGAGTRLITDLIPVAGQFVGVFVKTPPSNGGILVTARVSRAA